MAQTDEKDTERPIDVHARVDEGVWFKTEQARAEGQTRFRKSFAKSDWLTHTLRILNWFNLDVRMNLRPREMLKQIDLAVLRQMSGSLARFRPEVLEYFLREVPESVESLDTFIENYTKARNRISQGKQKT